MRVLDARRVRDMILRNCCAVRIEKLCVFIYIEAMQTHISLCLFYKYAYHYYVHDV